MRKRILTYRRKIDGLLLTQEQDWEAIRKEHLVQLSFFQQERLAHLIVTVAVAFLFMGAVALSVLSFCLPVFLLALLLLVLLVPYILHYYLLENEVQRMYEQYDRLTEKCSVWRREL